MIYRGPGFFAVAWSGSSTTLPPPFPPLVHNLSRRYTGWLRKRDNLLAGEGCMGEWERVESYGGKKAWSSIHYLILSGSPCQGKQFWLKICQHQRVLRSIPLSNKIKWCNLFKEMLAWDFTIFFFKKKLTWTELSPSFHSYRMSFIV